MADPRPVGLFDSGVGGLSVLREVGVLLPREDVLYLADTAWCPYGQRSVEEICQRSLQVGRWLLARGAKALVVACNTASAAALDTLRAQLEVPVVGMEPAVKPAAALTRSGRIGVLATPRTAESERLARLIQRYAREARVFVQECAELVPLIEQGELGGPRLEAALGRYLEPLLAQQVDVVVLGCTHYPLVQARIQALCGPEVQVVNPAPAVARQLARVLDQHGLRAPDTQPSQVDWWTTGSPAQLGQLLAALGHPGRPSQAAV
ncbi:MAG: glutamate racemase [Chloroflexi bacterium]|nr:glutamate racemase [Chloroflexota bacterium]